MGISPHVSHYKCWRYLIMGDVGDQFRPRILGKEKFFTSALLYRGRRKKFSIEISRALGITFITHITYIPPAVGKTTRPRLWTVGNTPGLLASRHEPFATMSQSA